MSALDNVASDAAKSRGAGCGAAALAGLVMLAIAGALVAGSVVAVVYRAVT